MKYFVLVIAFFCLSEQLTAQDIIRFGSEYKIPIYHPKTAKVGNIVLEPKYEIKSHSTATDLSFLVFSKKRFSLYGGVAYLFINYSVLNYLDTIKVVPDFAFDGVISFNKSKNAHSKSHSIGLKMAPEYKFIDGRIFDYKLGLSCEVYFYEFYKFLGYEPYKQTGGFVKVYGNNHFKEGRNYEYTMPFVNLSLENRFSFNLKDKMTLTAKISLGTNVHSEWAQFKRYVWLGTGLELGFWRKKKE